jgi:hypothetical protein
MFTNEVSKPIIDHYYEHCVNGNQAERQREFAENQQVQAVNL